MDRFNAMQVFVKVAQSGSFTATADRLEMSRAMVSRHVAELERWLGARLLQRTTRKVTLTDAGEQCLRRCLQVLALVEEVEDEISPQDGVLRGQLRVTSSMSFGHAQLAAALSEFLERHPALKIDLDVGDRALNLVESRIDLAIRISSEPDPALIARPLAPCDSVLVASPAFLAERGTPGHPAELADYPCMGYANFGRSTWQFTRGDEREAVNVATRLTANEVTVLMQAACAGGGIALQPTYLVAPLIAEGRLFRVLPEWTPPRMTIYALYPSRRQLPAAVRALLDFLVERFATLRW